MQKRVVLYFRPLLIDAAQTNPSIKPTWHYFSRMASGNKAGPGHLQNRFSYSNHKHFYTLFCNLVQNGNLMISDALWSYSSSKHLGCNKKATKYWPKLLPTKTFHSFLQPSWKNSALQCSGGIFHVNIRLSLCKYVLPTSVKLNWSNSSIQGYDEMKPSISTPNAVFMLITFFHNLTSF